MSRQRVLDPALAQFSGREPTISHRNSKCRRVSRPTRPRPRKTTRGKSSVEDRNFAKLQTELKHLEKEISSLKQAKDPYSFQSATKQIFEKLQTRRANFSISTDQEKLLSELNAFQDDESVIVGRLEKFHEERNVLDSEILSRKELIQTLTGQLNQAKKDLRTKQNRLDSLVAQIGDSKREQEMIQHNLQTKQAQLAEVEEQKVRRSEGLKLLSEVENKLSEAASQFSNVQRKFLSQWRNWTTDQMISWICELDSSYEQYRKQLSMELPKQAESGDDFRYFDMNVLLGLGIGKIRHRGQLMDNINALVNEKYGESKNQEIGERIAFDNLGAQMVRRPEVGTQTLHLASSSL